MKTSIKIGISILVIALAAGAALLIPRLEGTKSVAKPAGIPGWDLVFQDEFDGDALNKDNWSYQNWKPGTVNSELQQYTDAPENVYVKDGFLTIQALNPKKNKYTSGRLITYQKQEFKYGRFESRIKVPKGQGFLPAFWLLGKDNYYGKWPRCGEIDIMEVLGSEPNKLHCTIHYGSDSSRDARQSQGSKHSEKDLSKDFHVYACEWEPGEIRFYFDDELVHTETNWYSARNATSDPHPYPAPFNKPMYMILNLAVGGNWPGDPDATTKFGKQSQMVVDYVRVYQKQGGYEEMEANCTEPQPVFIPKRSETGNIIHNGDFSEKESLVNDGIEWRYLQAEGGVGEAKIEKGHIAIKTKNIGAVDYSIQLVQGEIPLRKGSTYTYSFDAWSDGNRRMTTSFKEQETWLPYFTHAINLTPEKQHFEFTFTVKDVSNDDIRLEYNMGAFGSKDTIYITNVSLVKQ